MYQKLANYTKKDEKVLEKKGGEVMEILALIISIIALIIALIIAILAYQKVGGVADLKKQTEVLTQVGDTVARATDSLRDKTADILDRMEAVVRGTEEKKEAPKAEKKKESEKRKDTTKARNKDEK